MQFDRNGVPPLSPIPAGSASPSLTLLGTTPTHRLLNFCEESAVRTAISNEILPSPILIAIFAKL